MSVPGASVISGVAQRWRQLLNLPSTDIAGMGGSRNLPSTASGRGLGRLNLPSTSARPGGFGPTLPSTLGGGRNMGPTVPSTGITGSLGGTGFAPSIRNVWMQMQKTKEFGDEFGRNNIGMPVDGTYQPRGLDGIKPWEEQIKRAAEEAGVPWQVVAAIMGIESGGVSGAVSPAGALGLMQIMPDIWGGLAANFGGDLTNPWTNIRTGAEILRILYDQWGSWDKAAAAYLGALNPDGTISDTAMDAHGTNGYTYVGLFHANLHALGYGNPSQGEYGSGGQPASPQAAVMLDFALGAQGTRYVWGGADANGFDCSGLVFAALQQVGVDIGRTAEQQYHNTARVDYTDLRPGDLVFFHYPGQDDRYGGNTPYINHVAIYIGNGQIVHATSNGGQVIVSSLNEPWLANYIAGYGRAF